MNETDRNRNHNRHQTELGHGGNESDSLSDDEMIDRTTPGGGTPGGPTHTTAPPTSTTAPPISTTAATSTTASATSTTAMDRMHLIKIIRKFALLFIIIHLCLLCHHIFNRYHIIR